MVPSGVGHGQRLHVVDRAALERDPGRRQVHRAGRAVPGADQAELPVLVAGRGRRRRPGRLRPAGRLDGDHAVPRQELEVAQVVAPGGDLGADGMGRAMGVEGLGRPEQQHVGAVGQHHERHDLAGRGPLERVGQQQRRLGRSRVADGGGQVLGQPSRAGGHLGAHHADGSRVRAGHDHLADGVGLDARIGEGQLERLLPERHVLHLAEALLPLLRPDVPRGAPPVEELLGDRRAAEVLGQHRCAVGAVADQQGRGRVAALPLVDARRQAGADVGGGDEDRVVPPQRRTQARRPPSGPSRWRRTPKPRGRGAGRRAPRWRWSCRRRPARSRRTRGRREATDRRRRAGAGPAVRPRPPWSWCPRRRRPPTACPCRRSSRTRP